MKTKEYLELERAAGVAYEALISASLFLVTRDDMNAALHLENKRHSPLTAKVIKAKDRLQDVLEKWGR